MKRKCLIALALVCGMSATAQKRAFTISDVYQVRNAYAPTVSADGTLAYALSTNMLKEQRSTSNLFVGDRQVTTDGKSYAPAWSADGKVLYYTSSASGLPQVWMYDKATGQSRQLTDYGLGVSDAQVSPDGRYIAFTAEVYPRLGADAQANIEARERKANNKLQAHVADRLFYRHWTFYVDGRYTHIIVYDTQNNTYTDVTPGNYHAPQFMLGSFAFSPDSKEICYVSNHDGEQATSTNSDLWTVSVTGGASKNITAANKAWDGSPQYSPDGRYIAYRFQQTPGYESDRFRLAVYDRTTGEKKVLADQFDNWIEDFKWSADSRYIYFLAEESGYHPLYRVDLRKGAVSSVIPRKAISSFDLAGKDTYYYTYSTTGKPTAIYKMTKGKETQLTHFNDSLEAAVDIRPAEEMWVKGADGDSVQVFVVKPHGFKQGERYPLVINVHGGPQSQFMDSFRGDWQVYPGAGYVVAYPNFHGSTGRGQKFCHDISGGWGDKPFTDVMRVTDMLASLDYVDEQRMGAMGWSYGGYFMNWLQGNTKRFKCLASMMGIYDLPSFWGTTEELWFPTYELQGQPWNSAAYKKWNPADRAAHFSTPTLIITGERDYRVSYNQSVEYFNTLQTLGIPSRLIIFDNDGHWPHNLYSMPLYYNAHLEWFHKYLGGAPAPWDSEKLINGEQGYE